MTRDEAINEALIALHKITMALASRKLLEKPSMNPSIRLGLEKKAMTDEEISNLASDTWQRIVLESYPKLPGTTVFECSPGDGEPR